MPVYKVQAQMPDTLLTVGKFEGRDAQEAMDIAFKTYKRLLANSQLMAEEIQAIDAHPAGKKYRVVPALES